MRICNRRKRFGGNHFDFCTIITGKSGRCSENCKFCAQSIFHGTGCETYPLLEKEELLKLGKYNEERGILRYSVVTSENCKFCAQSIFHGTGCETYPLLEKEELLKLGKYNEERGILRYSVVTSGKRLSKKEVEMVCEGYKYLRKNTEEELLKLGKYNEERGILRYSVVTSGKRLSKKEVEMVCEGYKYLRKNTELSLCGSHGLLDLEDFTKLKEAGVTRYHNNLETSRRYFPEICTTHSYEEKIQAIQNAKKAGLEVCSGGIIGMGETREDRVDLAIKLRKLEVCSVPLNILNPIPGTPLEKLEPISEEEIRKTAAIFRFLLPNVWIRTAGGRIQLQDGGANLFAGGINGAITGDMLTTSGSMIEQDKQRIQELGYEE